jgi:hypothetical protein
MRIIGSSTLKYFTIVLSKEYSEIGTVNHYPTLFTTI